MWMQSVCMKCVYDWRWWWRQRRQEREGVILESEDPPPSWLLVALFSWRELVSCWWWRLLLTTSIVDVVWTQRSETTARLQLDRGSSFRMCYKMKSVVVVQKGACVEIGMTDWLNHLVSGKWRQVPFRGDCGVERDVYQWYTIQQEGLSKSDYRVTVGLFTKSCCRVVSVYLTISVNVSFSLVVSSIRSCYCCYPKMVLED